MFWYVFKIAFEFLNIVSLEFVYLILDFRSGFSSSSGYVKTVKIGSYVLEDHRLQSGSADNEGPAQMDPESKVSSHEIWLCSERSSKTRRCVISNKLLKRSTEALFKLMY